MSTSNHNTLGQRYSRATALRHERLYGRGYQGPGRESVFRALTDRLALRRGMRVLDVGCGLGGDVFRLANLHGVEAVGVDASADMIEIARERVETDVLDPRQVSFVHGNVVDPDLALGGPWDVVWSRDAGAFLTPPDKVRSWQRLHALQPVHGQVLITDYCIGSGPISDAFMDRMRAWGQHMITVNEYSDTLRAGGYVAVEIEDRTEDLVQSQRDGLTELHTHRQELIADFGTEQYESLVSRWQAKIEHSTTGQLAWMVLVASRGAQ